MNKSSSGTPHLLTLRSGLTQDLNFFRTGKAILLHNPNPSNIPWSNPPQILNSDAIQDSPAFVLHVVVCRLIVGVFDHADSVPAPLQQNRIPAEDKLALTAARPYLYGTVKGPSFNLARFETAVSLLEQLSVGGTE